MSTLNPNRGSGQAGYIVSGVGSIIRDLSLYQPSKWDKSGTQSTTQPWFNLNLTTKKTKLVQKKQNKPIEKQNKTTTTLTFIKQNKNYQNKSI